jgi:deferrochelatase/peroxidase EfeB
VGRFSDATPLATDGSATGRSPALNKFNYKDDDKGTKCPQHAHIRTTNPREDPGERIARRGVPYGSRTPESLRWDSIEEPPERDVGLLFLCFQSKIAKQFEAIQERASKPDTFDPIIGQSKAPTDQKWPQGWDRKDLGFKPFNFHSVVTLKGGEYFFAPSISFLKGLAENKKPKSKKPKTKV